MCCGGGFRSAAFPACLASLAQGLAGQDLRPALGVLHREADLALRGSAAAEGRQGKDCDFVRFGWREERL